MNETYSSIRNTELKTSNKQLIELMSSVFTEGCSFRFQAGGSSMFPFINDGDVITLVPIEQKSVAIGDVVAFIKPTNNKLIVHRVIGTKKGRYLLKADNKNESDGWISCKHLLGIVNMIQRENKQIRIGLRWEKYPIALLSRANYLKFSTRIIWMFVRPLIERHIK